MNAMRGFDAAQAKYDAMVPDDFDDMEPSSEQYDEAFTRLVNDDSAMQSFLDDYQPDTTTVFQLFHKYDGIPSAGLSNELDATCDAMTATCKAFLDGYRTWLANGRLLAGMADTVMREEVEANRIEAEEYAADCRADARNPW